MQTTQTISELAGEAYGHFERSERPDGESYARLKDGSPEWLTDLVRGAHGEFLPDDWRYDAIHAALGAIHDSGAENADELDDVGHEFADQRVDVYAGDRLAWLSSHLTRASYCDSAREEFGGEGSDLIEQIGMGQYAELSEVFGSVRQSLEDRMSD